MQMTKFRTYLASGAFFWCAASSAAIADELVTTTTRSTTIDTPSSVAVNAVPGSVVYFRTASPSLLVTTLEGRRKDLDKMIDQARERGDISAQRCEAMKAELRRIARDTGSNEISYPLAVMEAEDLDLIATQYGTLVTAAPVYVPIISGSHFTVVDGSVFQLDDLSIRRIDLEGRITKDLLEGRLSESRAAELRAQLSNIGAEAAVYRADGNVDFKESRRLYTEFDRVASGIEKSAGKDNK